MRFANQAPIQDLTTCDIELLALTEISIAVRSWHWVSDCSNCYCGWRGESWRSSGDIRTAACVATSSGQHLPCSEHFISRSILAISKVNNKGDDDLHIPMPNSKCRPKKKIKMSRRINKENWESPGTKFIWFARAETNVSTTIPSFCITPPALSIFSVSL